MADRDDTDAANPTTSKPPRATNTYHSGFAPVNKPSLSTNTSSIPKPSKSPSPASGRVNGVAAKNHLAESHPMTTTSSSSSHSTAQPNGGNAEQNGVSPYGTRSRNRTGSSRPNYAEDRDIDADFEYAAKKKTTAATITPTHGLPFIDAELTSGSNTRRSSNSAAPPQSSGSKASTPNLSKEGLPGMSSFPVNSKPSSLPPAPAPSRKRKAPGGTPSAHPSTSGPTTSTPLASRGRAGPATSVAPISRGSNILTFDKCGGFLKNNKLKADDGTVLSLDGQGSVVFFVPDC